MCYVVWGVLLGTVVMAIAIIHGKPDAVLGIQDGKKEEKGLQIRGVGGDEKVGEWKDEKERWVTPHPNPNKKV